MSLDVFNPKPEDFPDQRVRRLAAHLHRDCKSSHSDQCDWGYGSWEEPRHAQAVWYQKAEKLVEVVDGPQREEESTLALGDRIQRLKSALEVKEEVDVLKDRVEGILTELSDRGVGVGLISDERRRQVEEEGWTPEHDDEHDDFQLTDAAISYAVTARRLHLVTFPRENPPQVDRWPDNWHWNPSDDPVRNLVKDGALIAAEIDRLKRLEVDDA